MATMYPPQNNGPHAVLAEAINASVTSITVADASMLPAAPNVLTIGLDEDAELVLLQSRTGNILTVQRGYNGTTAKAWNAGEWVYRAITAQDIAALQEAAKQHDNTVTVMTAAAWNALDTAARAALYTAGTRMVVVATDDGAAIILSLNANGGTRKHTGADIPVSGTDATMIVEALEARVKTEDIANNLTTADAGKVLSALQGKLLADLLALKTQCTLLYTNASPGSEFGAWKTSMNLNGYTSVLIEFYVNAATLGYRPRLLVPIGGEALAVGLMNTGRQASRNVTVVIDGVLFGDCYLRDYNTAGAGTVDNTYMVPYRTWAVKGV